MMKAGTIGEGAVFVGNGMIDGYLVFYLCRLSCLRYGAMTKIKIKRVYEEPAPGDGYRVFVDRLWPRGMKKEELHYDLWAKSLAPSTALRQWYHADPQGRWDEFRLRYGEELARSTAAAAFAEQIRKYDTATLLYAAKDPARNHALVLQSYLEKS